MKCVKCCNEINFNYCEPSKSQMTNRQLCFACNFWINIKEKQKQFPDVTCNIEGNAYYIDKKESGDKRWCGFSGAKFIIKFANGRVVETTNLWHNGAIPEIFKDDFKDNAEFVHEKLDSKGF